MALLLRASAVALVVSSSVARRFVVLLPASLCTAASLYLSTPQQRLIGRFIAIFDLRLRHALCEQSLQGTDLSWSLLGRRESISALQFASVCKLSTACCSTLSTSSPTRAVEHGASTLIAQERRGRSSATNPTAAWLTQTRLHQQQIQLA
jgi:hypothetical protein